MEIEILIIDDSLEIGESLKFILKQLDYECKFFSSSEKAMNYFQKELSPIIFLDIFLPNQNGLDLLPLIKKMNPFTQVIMMTSENDIENVVASLKNKAFDFLLKPFSFDSVKVSVERGVEYYNLLRTNSNYQENLESDMKFISSIQKEIISPLKSTNSIYADSRVLSFVSGSFYYSEEVDKKTVIIFGEIEGNGVTSSFIGLLTICLLKDILKKNTSPDKILSALNDELYYKINIHSLTAICLSIDKIEKKISYSNGGSTEPILINKESEEIHYLNSELSNIIGIMPKTEFKTKSIAFSPNSLLFLYNPGFLPSENKSVEGLKSFIESIQSINKEEDSFEKIKFYINNYVNKNEESSTRKNFSFYLQKL